MYHFMSWLKYFYWRIFVKRALCLLLGIAVLGSMTMVVGCFGDNGVGSILAAAIMITIVASTAGTGGAGAAAFMASTRERPAIVVAATRTLGATANGLKFRVTPYSNGAAAGTPVLTTGITTNNTIQASGSVSISADTTDFLVELMASNTPIMQSMIYTSANVTAAVDPDTTAQALIYAEWLKKSPTNKSVENFKKNFALNSSADDALATTIYNLINFDTTVSNLTDVNLASTTLIAAATTAASSISTETRVIPASTADFSGTWHVTSSTNPSGYFPVFITQSGSNLSGTVNNITPFTGTVSGQQAVLTVTPQDRTEIWNLTKTSDTAFSGNWTSTPNTGGASTNGTLTGAKQ